MNRTITIDVDTGQVTTTGNITTQEAVETQSAALGTVILLTAETDMLLATALHNLATGTINHALDMARNQHD